MDAGVSLVVGGGLAAEEDVQQVFSLSGFACHGDEVSGDWDLSIGRGACFIYTGGVPLSLSPDSHFVPEASRCLPGCEAACPIGFVVDVLFGQMMMHLPYLSLTALFVCTFSGRFPLCGILPTASSTESHYPVIPHCLYSCQQLVDYLTPQPHGVPDPRSCPN